MPAVSLIDVTRRYGRLPALDGVSFEVQPGHLAAILGPNGAGKTTLLRIIGGLDEPDSGQVRVGSHRAGHVDAGPHGDIPRRHGSGTDGRHGLPPRVGAIGLVGHQSFLYAGLTVADNLAFFAALAGQDADRVVAERLADVGASGLHRRPVSQLSHGQRRRVAIARALLHDPTIVLMDEPYAGLDPGGVAALDAVLAGILAKGHTVIMTSHGVASALERADTAVVLRAGRVLWTGLSSDVPSGALEAAYGTIVQIPAAPARLGPTASVRKAEASVEAGPRPAGVWASAAAMGLKDLRLEFRTRESVPISFVFGALVIVLLAVSLGPAALATDAAAGALWVAVAFGTILGFLRAAHSEVADGAVSALAASGSDRGGLFLGKWAAALIQSCLVAVVLVGLATVLVPLPTDGLPGLLLVIAAALPGWAATGTLASGIVSAASGREGLAPVLMIPLAMPLLIQAVQASADALLRGGASPASLAIIGAYDVVFITLGFLAYGLVLEATT